MLNYKMHLCTGARNATGIRSTFALPANAAMYMVHMQVGFRSISNAAVFTQILQRKCLKRSQELQNQFPSFPSSREKLPKQLENSRVQTVDKALVAGLESAEQHVVIEHTAAAGVVTTDTMS